MKRLKRMLLVLAVVLVAIQLVPVPRTNPPVEERIPAPPEVQSILRRSCMDCHSNETTWPWYSRVAPVSWLVVNDVNRARRHVNLSTWNRLSAADRAEAAEHIREEVLEGEMPLPLYLPLHSEARLSDADKKLIEDWTRTLK